MIKYIFFDVSGTLLHKPSLYEKINQVLVAHGYNIDNKQLVLKHKLLSEVIFFPDRTDAEFYKNFNAELLRLLGICPKEEIVDDIFNNCTYLPWETYDDTHFLKEIDIPIGVISNFNTTLRQKLDQFFGPIFNDILVSEELGVAKPKIEFYKKALEVIKYKPDEVLYIGDSLKLDVEPARKIGFECLLIDRDQFYKSSPFSIQSIADIKKYLK